MRRVTIALDSGAHYGIAIFRDGVLITCDQPDRSIYDLAPAIGRHVGAARAEVVVEAPNRIFRGKRADSILTLAFRAGEAAGVLGHALDCVPIRVAPDVWKGGTRKPRSGAQYTIDHRVRRILRGAEIETYTQALERLPESRQWDVADAVGLGLFHEKRASRGVLPWVRRSS